MSGSAAQDRWWRGIDALVLDALPRGSRILDVGCGHGAFVEQLAEGGLDAVGVDPHAPARPRLIQQRVENLEPLEPFDAACALMSLHHAELDSAVPSIARLLRPGGRLFVYEFAWETYDERAAAWATAHDVSGSDRSVAAWMSEHADLHTGSTVHAALRAAFDLELEEPRPYLARMLGAPELEPEEHREIAAGRLPPLGRLWIGAPKHRSLPPEIHVPGRTDESRLTAMTRDEAELRAAELNREHPDRHKARWVARERDGAWEVARISLPAGMRIDPVTETTEAKPKPPGPGDPRPAFERNVGGPYGPV